jgi:hypothetical protein
MSWQPAESAPGIVDLLVAVDGTAFTSGKPEVVIAHRVDQINWTERQSGDFCAFSTDQVLGWMELPEPPTAEELAAGVARDAAIAKRKMPGPVYEPEGDR